MIAVAFGGYLLMTLVPFLLSLNPGEGEDAFGTGLASLSIIFFGFIIVVVTAIGARIDKNIKLCWGLLSPFILILIYL